MSYYKTTNLESFHKKLMFSQISDVCVKVTVSRIYTHVEIIGNWWFHFRNILNHFTKIWCFLKFQMFVSKSLSVESIHTLKSSETDDFIFEISWIISQKFDVFSNFRCLWLANLEQVGILSFYSVPCFGAHE